MPPYSTQELENRLLAICRKAGGGVLEEDILSRDVFELRNLVDKFSTELQKTPAGIRTLTKLKEIFPRLIQPAFLFQEEKSEASLRVLASEVQSLTKQTIEHPALSSKLDAITKYYQAALKRWENADANLRQQLSTVKPQLALLNTSNPKFYYINKELALKMLCRNDQGEDQEKTLDGVRNVAQLVTPDNKSVFVKADPPGLNHIDIRGQEVWDAFDVIMFGSETIAPTLAAKLSCVSITPKNNFSAMEVVNEIRQTVPGTKDIVAIERVLQGSEGVPGILLSELLELNQSFNWLLKDIGQQELIAKWNYFVVNYIQFTNPQKNDNPKEFNEKYLDFILSLQNEGRKLPAVCQKFKLADEEGKKQFFQHIEKIAGQASKQEMQHALTLMQSDPKLIEKFSLEYIVLYKEIAEEYLEFILSAQKAGRKLPTDCQKFKLDDDEGQKQFFRHIEKIARKKSKHEMRLAIKLMTSYPQLMAEHSLDQIIVLPKLFKKIAELLPGYFNDAEKVIATIPSLLDLIDIENYSKLFFLNIYKINSDAKADNHMTTPEIVRGEVRKINAVSFDNNEAGEAKCEIQNPNRTTLPGLKTIIFHLPQFKQKVAEKVKQSLIKGGKDFIYAWLANLYEQEFNYQRHIKAEVINRHDIYGDEQKKPVLNFNFLFTPAYIEALEQDIQRVVEVIRNNPDITHETVLNTIDPVLARYYEVIAKKSSWLIHKINIIYTELTMLLASPDLMPSEAFVAAVNKVIENYFVQKNLPEVKNEIIAEITRSLDKKLKGKELLDAIEKVLFENYSRYISSADEQPYEAQNLLFSGKDAPMMEHALRYQLNDKVIINGKVTSVEEELKRVGVDKKDPRFHKTDNVLTTIQKFIDSKKKILLNLPNNENDEDAWSVLERIAKHFPFITTLPIPDELLNQCWSKVIATDNATVAKLLINCGANPNYVSKTTPLPPLFQAMKRWPYSALNVLDVLLNNDKVDINAEHNGLTALFLAVSMKRIDLIKKLVATHRVNLEKRLNGFTVMEYAMREDNAEAFAELAQLGAGLSLDAQTTIDFIKRHLKNSNNPEDPKNPMNLAWATLKKQNLMIGWQTAIEDMTDPLSKNSKDDPEFIIEGVFTGERVINPKFRAQMAAIFDADDNPLKKNPHGMHTVPDIDIDNPILGKSTFFLKFSPNNPWVDLLYLYTTLLLFKTPVSAPLDLFRIVHKGKVYVVLMSLKGGDMELKDFVNADPESVVDDVVKDKSQPAKNLNHVDPRYFAIALFMAVLFRHKDGKVDNSCAARFINAFGVEFWRFLIIDTEQMFGKLTERVKVKVEEKKDGDKQDGNKKDEKKDASKTITHRVMGVKDYLFCLPDKMLKELDREIVDKFTAHDPEQIIEKMFSFLKIYEERCAVMFKPVDKERFEKQPAPNNVKLDVLFPKGAIANFYKVFMEIKRIYQSSSPRAIEVLRLTTPVVGHVIAQMLALYPDDAAQCYLETYHPNGEQNGNGVFVTKVMGRKVVGLETHAAVFRTNMAAVNRNQNNNQPPVLILLSREAAYNEFKAVFNNAGQVSDIRDALLQGKTGPFEELINDITCQEVISSTFPSAFDGSQKKPMVEPKGTGLRNVLGKLPQAFTSNNPLDAQIKPIARVLKQRVILSINLTNVKLSAKALSRLIRKLPFLQSLNLTGCVVTPEVITAVTGNCWMLQEITFGKSDKLKTLGEINQPLGFTTLQIFAVNDCTLEECHISGAEITSIQFKNNPNLRLLTTTCRNLENATIVNCPALDERALAKVIGESPKLLNKILSQINDEISSQKTSNETNKTNEIIAVDNIANLKKFFGQNPQVVVGFFRDKEWTPELVKFLFRLRTTLARTIFNSNQLTSFIQICKENQSSVEKLDLSAVTAILSINLMVHLLKTSTLKNLDCSVYKKPDGLKTLKIAGGKNNVKKIAVAPDGEVYAVLNEGKKDIICHLDIASESGGRTDIFMHNNTIRAFFFTPVGDLVIADALAVNIYRISKDKALTLIKTITLMHTKNFIKTALLMNDILLIADEGKDSILVQHLDLSVPAKVFECRNRQVNVMIPWGKTQFLSGAYDGSLTLWECAAGENSYLTNFQAHESAITVLEPLSSELVAIGFEDQTIKIVNVSERNIILTLEGHSGAITALKLLQDNLLLSGDDRCEMRVWDLSSGKHVYSLLPHKGAVNAFAQLWDGRVLSALGDGTVRVLSFAIEKFDFTPLSDAIKIEITTKENQITMEYEIDKDKSKHHFVATCIKLITNLFGDTVKTINDIDNNAIIFQVTFEARIQQIKRILLAIKERVVKPELDVPLANKELSISQPSSQSEKILKLPKSSTPPGSSIKIQPAIGTRFLGSYRQGSPLARQDSPDGSKQMSSQIPPPLEPIKNSTSPGLFVKPQSVAGARLLGSSRENSPLSRQGSLEESKPLALQTPPPSPTNFFIPAGSASSLRNSGDSSGTSSSTSITPVMVRASAAQLAQLPAPPQKPAASSNMTKPIFTELPTVVSVGVSPAINSNVLNAPPPAVTKVLIPPSVSVAKVLVAPKPAVAKVLVSSKVQTGRSSNNGETSAVSGFTAAPSL